MRGKAWALAALMLLVGCGGSGGGNSGGASGPAVGLRPVAEGMTAPVALAAAPGDASGRLFVVDQVGAIRVVSAQGALLPAPFLDLRGSLVALDPNYDERGLLGLAFHPQFATNGRFFVYYTAPPQAAGSDHTNVVSEFQVSADPNVADPASETVLLRVDHPQANHNGGTLAFGPDGFLHISIGDGGGANDVGPGHVPGGNAQSLENLLGKILRIDVDQAGAGTAYAIPPDNPFAGAVAGRDEIFAFGLRNPYRFSFDRGGSRQLLAGDAGQNLREEVDVIVNGGNYGWNVREGAGCFDPANPDVSPPTCPAADSGGRPLRDPVIDFPNAQQPGGLGLAVVGGHVYRGAAIPGLAGSYVFGAWSAAQGAPDGRLFVATPRAAGPWPFSEAAVAGAPNGRLGRFLRGFGEDAAGELYALTGDTVGPTGATGKVFKLVP